MTPPLPRRTRPAPLRQGRTGRPGTGDSPTASLADIRPKSSLMISLNSRIRTSAASFANQRSKMAMSQSA